MPERRFHLAQVNVGRVLAPVDSPQLADFAAALDPVNALADAAPGFVWRLQTEDGNATAVRAFDDDMLLLNMSLWESLESLASFVYREGGHVEIMRRRREFFEPPVEAFLALWWVPVGHVPTPAEGRERLEHLRADGPSSYAFTFRQSWPAPGEAKDTRQEARDDWTCPTG